MIGLNVVVSIDGDDNGKGAKGNAEYAGAHGMRFLAAGVQAPKYGTPNRSSGRE